MMMMVMIINQECTETWNFSCHFYCFSAAAWHARAPVLAPAGPLSFQRILSAASPLISFRRPCICHTLHASKLEAPAVETCVKVHDSQTMESALVGETLELGS